MYVTLQDMLIFLMQTILEHDIFNELYFNMPMHVQFEINQQIQLVEIVATCMHLIIYIKYTKQVKTDLVKRAEVFL